MAWVPLHVHSQYSILDSTCSVKQLLKQAQQWQLSALGLTDSGNMYGAVDFFKSCKAQSLKPLLGCELYVAVTSRHDKKRIAGSHHAHPIVLLVKDKQGYQNLSKLTSLGFTEGFYYYPRIDKELLEKYHEGLICLSGPLRSHLGQLHIAHNQKQLIEEVQWYKNLFQEDYYFELQRHQMTNEQLHQGEMDAESWLLAKYEEYIEHQTSYNDKLLELAKEYSIEYVATNDTHYIFQEDWKAHEILLNVQSGEPCEIWERDSRGVAQRRIKNPKRKTYSSHSYYFKSPQEMQQLFADLPDALSNTEKIAEKCNFDFDFRSKHYPVFYPPGLEDKNLSGKERKKAAEIFLHDICQQAIKTRYPKEQLEKIQKKFPDSNPMEVITQRLEKEFSILSSKELSDYMLIVYDFISWAKKNEIPVGPGRGSAAGSIIAFLIGITDIEPLQLNLLFERFINPERVSYPDIDVDICMERRQEVIDYTIEKYGKEKVAQIITFGTMKAKMAIKDVGRVLSVPLSKVNAIAKLVPDDLNITLEKALEIDKDLSHFYESDEEAKRIIDMAMKIEGSIRNTSTHAAGLIISAHPITDHVPICIAKDSDMYVTQYSMKPVEAVGMLKIDFLGLKTLTSIEKAVSFAEKNFDKKIPWTQLPLDDKKTFDLLNQGKNLGVFQLESGGMQELVKKLHIDNFEEIIAVNALYRPGPMDMIPSFINRKHGKEAIEIDHPDMKDILKETYGVMVYQEQVMQIASTLAGYSLGEGDMLRKAMGKKDRKEMQRQKEKFISGAIEKGIEEGVVVTIFDKIEKFASYGFNKSHAAAYAYLSYATAYLKANYPHEWMAALMTCDRDDLTKVAKFIGDAKSMGIAILPPDVNEAGIEFIPTKEGIRFAMSGIKGVGQAIVEAIVEERQTNGLYKSLYDFIKRLGPQRIGKKAIELLVDAGAFAFTTWTKDQLRLLIEPIYDEVTKEHLESSKGVMNLFSLIEKEEDKFNHPPKVTLATSEFDELKKEKELLGFYLTNHPLKLYADKLSQFTLVPLKQIQQSEKPQVVCTCFDIDVVKTKIASKSQRKFAILSISDNEERLEMPVWPELYDQASDVIVENTIVIAIIQVDIQEAQLRYQLRYIEDLSKFDEKKVKECLQLLSQYQSLSKKQGKSMQKQQQPRRRLDLFIDVSDMKMSNILQLKNLFRESPGNDSITIIFKENERPIGSLEIVPPWGVKIDEIFESKLSKLSFVSDKKVI